MDNERFSERNLSKCLFAEVIRDQKLKEMISKSVKEQRTLGGYLFGVSDDEANAISVLLNNGWTIQLDSKLDCFGLKRKGV